MATYKDAVARLNSCNLENLLGISATLSAFEFFTGPGGPLFSLLNNEAARLLSDAIVESRAATYKGKMLSPGDFRFVLNGVNSALNDPRFPREVRDGSPREELLYGFLKFFSRMGNIQLRAQRVPLKYHIGWCVGMFDTIPSTSTSEFPAEWQAFAAGMREKVIATLGCSVFEFGVAHLAVAFPYRNLTNRVLQAIARQAPRPDTTETQTGRQARLMSGLVADIARVEGSFNPTWEDIRAAAPPQLSNAVMTSFLSTAARDIGTLRELRTKPGFDSGVEGWRLSPLERFPIVKIDSRGDTRYAIPNLRTYFRAFPELVHFTLLEAFGNQFNEFRGPAQEVYLRSMLRDQHPMLPVIPEQPYRRGKDNVRGPDLTIIDSESKTLIVVESKARRTLAETRFTMDEESFDRNFADVYEALRKLPRKIEEIRNLVGPYSQWSAEIGSVQDGTAICVCVVGEAVYFMTEVMRFRAEREPAHPLAKYPYPYCVMSMETFEIAVAISREEKVPIGRVFLDFWKASQFRDPSKSTAEHFEGYGVDALTLFGEEFAREAAT